MNFLKKPLVIAAGVVVAAGAAVGFFTIGPGGDSYETPQGGYSNTYDGHTDHEHEGYGVR